MHVHTWCFFYCLTQHEITQGVVITHGNIRNSTVFFLGQR
uniref:Uncharacterized protein n=1 Tax=Anguilla anguilla TaxID=7936 RepID=A0A0E9XP89_ANGAN